MLPLAFTGHRKLEGKYQVPKFIQDHLLSAIETAKGWGFDEFRCGMAVGTDMYFAEQVLAHNYPLIAFLPFKGYEDMWPKAQKEQLKALLAKAAQVKYVSEPPYYPWKMILRDKVMVQDTSLVLSVWDGRTEGGTFKTIEYAKELRLPIWNINPKGKVGWL